MTASRSDANAAARVCMSCLGGDDRSVFFGNDIRRRPTHEGRAITQHNHDVVPRTSSTMHRCQTPPFCARRRINFVARIAGFPIGKTRRQKRTD